MTFYRLHIEVEKRGSFAERETLLHHFDEPHWQSNLMQDRFPEFDPVFGELWLSDKSSLVDFVNDGSATGGLGLLVSRKALDVLNALTLPPHRVYQLIAKHRGKKIVNHYYWLQILYVDYYDYIDFVNTEFELRNLSEMDDLTGQKVAVENGNQLRALVESAGDNNQEVHFLKLVFNERFKTQHFDLFYLGNIEGVRSGFPLVTSRLKEAFEKNGLTGYRLMPSLRTVCLE